MSLPTTDIGICNLALDMLKETSITSLTTTPTGLLCGRWYDVVRRATLESYNWNFALLSAAISRGGTPSVSDYTDYYTLPATYLKLRAIIEPEIPLGRRRYEIQGLTLLYDHGGESTLKVWHTKDHTTISEWPALFIQLMSEELALKLGKKLTARPSIIKDIKEDLVETRRLARAMDGQVRPPRRYESSRIVNAGLSPSANRTVAGDYEFPDGMDD
jgi:hypothetical protein